MSAYFVEVEITEVVWNWIKPEPSKSYKPSTIEPLLTQSSRALEGLGLANLLPHFVKAHIFGHEPRLIPDVNIPLLSSWVQTRIDDKTPFKRNKQIRCWVILATISWTLCHNFGAMTTGRYGWLGLHGRLWQQQKRQRRGNFSSHISSLTNLRRLSCEE